MTYSRKKLARLPSNDQDNIDIYDLLTVSMVINQLTFGLNNCFDIAQGAQSIFDSQIFTDIAHRNI